MLQFLTSGRYDAGRTQFLTPDGATRCYYATDNVVNVAYRRLTPDDLIGALSEYGKIGVVAIEADQERAQALFRDTVRVLDEEAARG